MQSTRYSCQILMELEFSQQISEKYSNIKYQNPSNESRVVPCGQTTDTGTDGRTGRHEEASSRFSQAYEGS
jgi:hypothetical protein